MKSASKRKNRVFLSVLFFLALFATPAAAGARKVLQKPTRPPAFVKGPVPGSVDTAKLDLLKRGSKENEVYDPTGKPDPFKSFIAKQEEYEAKKKIKPKTYLQTLDLSQLDLIATVLSSKGNWAMVRDAKGLGHVVRKGTLIGTNEGVVERILEGEILIREKHMDIRGNTVVRVVRKKMATKK